ncbi:MAG TPA: hypothetical protein VM533_04885, partial [Fimbriiglobus sp.]|nr:hypothetical protein [Fimbriiglobus sp.]
VVHHVLRDLDTALWFYRRGLRYWPQSPTLHTGIGMILYSQGKEARGLHHLWRATKKKSLTAAPYLALIAHHFRKGEYAIALGLANDGWENAQSDDEKGSLLSWMAMCRCELGAERDLVHGLFDRAVQLRPDSKQIAENRQAYLEHLVGGVVLEWPHVPEVASHPHVDFIDSEDLVLVE